MVFSLHSITIRKDYNMNYDLINLIIQAFIAVGTVGAVCVSLYYSHKAVSTKSKLLVFQQFTEHFSERYINLVVTFVNTGNYPIALSKLGRSDGIYRNVVMDDLKDYMVSGEKQITINPNEIKVIEYRKEFEDEPSPNNINKWKETNDYQLLSNATFYAEDTNVKHHPDYRAKRLKKRLK